MSAHDTILRDYRTHFGLEPDALFGWDIPEEYRKPHPYALQQILKGGVSRTGVASAVTVVMMIVPIITFILSQRQVMETMASSGIKD